MQLTELALLQMRDGWLVGDTANPFLEPSIWR